MFINFRKVFEYLFSSFDIAGDTKLIEKFESEGIKFLMLIKRHWIYSIIHSWKVIFILKIALLNIYLLLFSEKGYDIVSIFIAGFLALNVGYWLIIVIHYIYEFYKIQGNKPNFSDVYSVLKKSKESDRIFTNFFNQTIFILFLLVGLTIFTFIIGIAGLIQGGATTFGVGILNAFLLIIQVLLFYSFLLSMINQEMDFKVVIPGKVMFFNQIGVLGDSQNLNANKIKTINTQYPGILGSFFNYGDIIIFTEGDQQDKGQMRMDYIGNPQATVKEIEKILKNETEVMQKEISLLLKNFKEKIGYFDNNREEKKSKMKDIINENEAMLKAIFEAGDEQTQNQIKELFTFSHT